jgi:alkaline phosphatase
MRHVFKRLTIAAAIVFAEAMPADAQTIYPFDRAEILSGSHFDFKVEFPSAPAPQDIKITIDGSNAEAALGAASQIVEKEDGGPNTAYWIRSATLATPGKHTVEAIAGDAKARATWTVFATPEGRHAKNVILFIGDGLSMAHRTAARMLSKGITQGHYGGDLAIDDMPYMALISTAGTDSIITDSANSMSAYTTGHKTCVNALAVYCAQNGSTLTHPRVETIGELIKRKSKLALGVVTNTEIEDATPAAMVAHTRSRNDYSDIARMFFEVKPDVVLGGGSAHFLPKSNPDSKRADEEDFVAKFKDAGYAYAATNTELLSEYSKPETKSLLGLFNRGNIDGALDRLFLKKGTVAKYPDQPDLTDEVKAALSVLSRHDDGFMLMVESGRIDKYSHSLDWERAVYDTIMLDNAVKVAKDWAGDRNDTLIIVVGDHGHPVSIIGTYDDDEPGQLLRDKLMTYDKAKFPNYPPANAEGYPPTVDVSRRLAMVFAAYPDHCDTGKPHLFGENQPTVLGPDGKTYLANEDNCQATATRRAGLLPFTAEKGVHSGDDVVLTAMGPGAEQFHGHMENTRVFRAIVTALGLGQ